ncbi:DUF6235 family protein [Actinocrispum wychmicini]|uniref:Uncharacterized protein n=1 Tax=Actinocrispum wychmicini TaxID=1213861 RepID=A0A4R2J858_9PSEU|nr:DUF6235 family protein [Actinocrispum wychmicini]TCO54397.1 hypothetical protein EV192_109378 [Actinocrispum wychmicini]
MFEMMDNFECPAGPLSGRRNQLNTGLDVLDEWSETAPQAARNLVYRALFAVTDGTLFRSYLTMSHRERPEELAICLRDNLVVTISRTQPGFFDIAYIGSPDQAPGIRQSRD